MYTVAIWSLFIMRETDSGSSRHIEDGAAAATALALMAGTKIGPSRALATLSVGMYPFHASDEEGGIRS